MILEQALRSGGHADVVLPHGHLISDIRTTRYWDGARESVQQIVRFQRVEAVPAAARDGSDVAPLWNEVDAGVWDVAGRYMTARSGGRSEGREGQGSGDVVGNAPTDARRAAADGNSDRRGRR